MEVQLIRLKEEYARKEGVTTQHCIKLEAALKGTEMQLVSVSDQLAQRTILYEAQERRWKSSLSGQTTLSNDRNQELVELKARFDQMQQQYYQMDSDRMEALLENREIRTTLSVIETERAEERARLERAEEELSTAVHFSHELQQQLDRVKGADLTVLEQSMAAENENIRDRAEDRENELLRQLEMTRDSLMEEKRHREELVDEMQSLHQKNRRLSELLKQLRVGEDVRSLSLSMNSFENLSDVDGVSDTDSATFSGMLNRTDSSGFRGEQTGGFHGSAKGALMKNRLVSRHVDDDDDDVVNIAGSSRSVQYETHGRQTIHSNDFAANSSVMEGLNESFLTGIIIFIAQG